MWQKPYNKKEEGIMKRAITILMILVVLLSMEASVLAERKPDMQLRVGIPKMTLWSEPTNKSDPVKNEQNKSVKLKVGDIVYETEDQFGRSDYGDYYYVSTNGYEGYVCKKYLIYGYKIRLEGRRTQNIYRTEWGATHESEEIGTVSAYRKAEELLVIDETVNCLHVLTVEKPESIEGYISRYAYYSYIYD